MRQLCCGLITGLGFLICGCHSKPANDNQLRIDSAATSVRSLDSAGQAEPAQPLFGRIDSTFTGSTVTDTSQLMLINRPMAIILFPDSLTIEKEKQNDSDVFYASADDYSYYTALAQDTLTYSGIRDTVFNHDRRYIVFKHNDRLICTFDGNKMPDSWGMILFNGTDTPLLWDPIDIGVAIDSLFKK